jgi:hypothetical protein
LIALFVVGCFSPQFSDGTQPCASDRTCPPGLTCGGDNKCHVGAVSVDASIDGHADAAIDAPVPCGNGRLDPGEMCDPAIPANMAGHCPTLSDCNDGDVCTTDTVQGSAATCDAVCHHETITTCGPSDSCCPAGVACNHNQDPDCSPSCGNGAVETGETCDKAIPAGQQGACPTLADCNDNNTCTSDSIVGSADTCTAQCLHTTISTCGLREGCCPSNCNANTDPDCSPVCGNGTVETGETCDPPSSCPQSAAACNDGNACTVDTLGGNPSQCTAVCVHTPINACTGGDGCCAPGCNANNDTDCTPVCGNGAVEAGETCDPPSSCPQNAMACDDNNSCTTDTLTGMATSCTALCVHTPITACNNTVNDGCCPSGCNTTNDRDCNPVCGNRVVESGELCDTCIIRSGQTCNAVMCPAGCTTAATGFCPTLADCNDGNPCTIDTLAGTGCQQHCVHTQDTSCSPTTNGCCPSGCNANNDPDCSPVCGNGVVEPGENCDTAIGPGLSGHCPSSAADCNDGLVCTVDAVSGTACAAQCTHTALTCTPGIDNCCPTGCNANNDGDCPPVCGNGVVEPGEYCDTAIPQGFAGACPQSCSSTGTMCVATTLVNPGTCQAFCSSSGGDTTCTNGNQCCPFGCNSTNDNDCRNPSGWIVEQILASGQSPSCATPATTGDIFTECPCTLISFSMTQGKNYVITTCKPTAPSGPGASDTTLELLDSGGSTRLFANDDCHAPSLVHMAGWSCTNANLSEYESCITDDTGGFQAPYTGTYNLCLRAYPYQAVGSTTNITVTLWSN